MVEIRYLKVNYVEMFEGLYGFQNQPSNVDEILFGFSLRESNLIVLYYEYTFIDPRGGRTVFYGTEIKMDQMNSFFYMKYGWKKF